MSAAAPPADRLRFLRWMTWATLLLCVALVAAIIGLELAGGGRPPTVLASLGLAAAVVCAVSARLLHTSVLSRARPGPRPVVTAALAAVAVLVLSRAFPPGGFPWATLPALLLTAVWAGGWRRLPVALVGGGGSLAASLTGAWLAGDPAPWRAAATDAGIVVLVSASLLAQVWFWQVAAQLDRARRTEREAAVSDERLRFAADLHDIQGHSLQVIALKSELAARLVGTDPARAADEMRQVQALARQALGDTREVVRGYRAVSLDTEITNATRVLAAAGVDCRMSRAADLPELPGGVEHLLGLTVREGTTNVIRHSRARRADIALTVGADGVHLRFDNDAPLAAVTGPGGGLAALADRFAAAGGRLAWRHDPDGFAVTAVLPVAAG